MKIGVIGGAFNPPHIGHAQLADIVAPFFDKVWILPAYDHMYGKKMQLATHRLEMCELAFENLDKIQVSDYEIRHKLNDGTFSLMWQLNGSYPEHSFSFIVGQDNADTITRWRNYKQLLLLTPFLVVPRKGYPVNTNPKVWYKKLPHRYLSGGASIPEISSTQIRKDLVNKKKPAHLSEPVLSYISDKGLY